MIGNKNNHPSSLFSSSAGAGLLELLLAMAVFMSILPFVYNFVMDHREQSENAEIVHKIKSVSAALETYISDNRRQLLAPVSANVVRVKLSDLKNIELNDEDAAKIQLRAIKSKDSGGRSFVQGIVIFDSPKLTPLRTRQIAMAGGAQSGFADGRMLYGSFGTWHVPASLVNASVGSHSVLAETKTFRSGGDYLQRLPSSDPLDATMQSDLDMGGHSIEDAKNITAQNTRFLDLLEADAIDASKMTVQNRLDWTAPLEVFGDAFVNGSISSDNRTLYSGGISITGRSALRSVTVNDLTVDNLSLFGFSVATLNGEPAILSISGALDMTKGHIRALDSYVGFSGSVTPKLVVTGKIEDGQNDDFYWDVSYGNAALQDLSLSNLSQIMRQVYAREKTGKTETERLMGGVAQNSNATVSDYMRVLEQIKKTVEGKYREIVK